MNISDQLKLIYREYRNGKQDWIITFVLQFVIYAGLLFVFTIACDIDQACGEYVRTLYPNGFEFNFIGYRMEDISILSKMGFHDLSFSSVGNMGYGTTDTLEGIWIYKIYSVFIGKDIWNSDMDEILCMIFFCQVVFGIIGISLFFLMMNNLSNSFAMRITRREKYIHMMTQLGCPNNACWFIFGGAYLLSLLIAYLGAIIVNGKMIQQLNIYLTERMYIHFSFAPYDKGIIIVMGMLNAFVMFMVFRKQWRHRNAI